MKDIEKICAKYEAKARQSRREIRDCPGWRRSERRGLSQDFREEAVQRQVANYRAALILSRMVEILTRDILDTEEVSTFTYPFYYAFARSLLKLRRHGFSDETLALETATLICTWVGRGLSQSVLEAIRTEVFDIPAPKP